MIKSMSSKPIRAPYRSRWQNGAAECWVGSCRRELLDSLIVFNAAHPRRLAREYLRYYHEDRTHDGLGKDSPEKRVVERRKGAPSRLVCPVSVGSAIGTRGVQEHEKALGESIPRSISSWLVPPTAVPSGESSSKRARSLSGKLWEWKIGFPQAHSRGESTMAHSRI